MSNLFFISIIEGLFILVILFLRNLKTHQNSDLEKYDAQATYEKEILQGQIEIQNSKLKSIGQELQDNIGQLLSVVKINLYIIEEGIEAGNYDDFARKFQQTNDLITRIMLEIRTLSKGLDTNFIQEFSLSESITGELSQIRKAKKIETNFVVKGNKYSLGYNREIILFRVVQEILSNALKHSEVKKIEVEFSYFLDNFTLNINDDGKTDENEKLTNREASGFCNCLGSVNRRATLINFDCKKIVGRNYGTKYYLTTRQIFL